MKEFLETVGDELRRMVSEGQDCISLDDESLRILRRMAATELAAEKGAEINAELGDDANEPEAVKFAAVEDISIETQKIESPKSIKVVKSKAYKPLGDLPLPTPFSLPEGSKLERWEALRNIVMTDKVLNAHLALKQDKKLVFGVGNLDADIFFCGEAPGADEEIQGEPFVGRAGQLLTKIISAMGLSREQVYIGNILNWRPEMPTSRGNRKPEPDEIRYCLPYLKAQIDIIKPKVVVALGGTAIDGLLGADPSRRLGKIRGVWHNYEGYDLMITYHPSFLLQYATNEMKRLVWEDMMAVMERVGMEITPKQRSFFKNV